ncbi:MAG: DUF3800 domain-containing protein [Chloroflexi bacterium]|nr:DUF3800 domain-containing protein [Chloroflexota bacterium]
MPKNQHWTVFADDTGDPGVSGSEHFGYALVAVERADMHVLIRLMSEFRVNHTMFTEAKVKIGHALFRPVIEGVSTACEDGMMLAGACIIRKPYYDGPYLRDAPDIAADPHFLRNFTIRHALEVLFAGVPFDDEDTIEVVLDRVDYNDKQIMNLRDYLSSAYAKEGAFAFPKARYVTHADSVYVEGLQVANHLAELVCRLHSDENAVTLAAPFMRIKTLVRSRSFSLDPRSESGMGRKARRNT